MRTSNETAQRIAESLLHPAIRPHDDRNQASVPAGFVERRLTELHPAFFIRETLRVPFVQQFDARRAAANRVDQRTVTWHRRSRRGVLMPRTAVAGSLLRHLCATHQLAVRPRR